MAQIDDILAEMQSKQGTELGVSEWVTVTQEMIDMFAECTHDHQWIHVDPARAADALSLLQDACREEGSALVVVTHDARALSRFARVVTLDELTRSGDAR